VKHDPVADRFAQAFHLLARVDAVVVEDKVDAPGVLVLAHDLPGDPAE